MTSEHCTLPGNMIVKHAKCLQVLKAWLTACMTNVLIAGMMSCPLLQCVKLKSSVQVNVMSTCWQQNNISGKIRVYTACKWNRLKVPINQGYNISNEVF